MTVDDISYLHINSASYYWLGGKVKRAEYKDSLFASLSFDPSKGEVTITGTKSEWKKGTPEDVNYFKGKYANLKGAVAPQITDRVIKRS